MANYKFVGVWNAELNVEPRLSRWDTYANHRDIVSKLIVKSAPPHADTLCVLGAGICYDLDLIRLTREFSAVTLLDLSEKDVVSGIQFQQSQGLSDEAAKRIKIIGGCDMTGIHEKLRRLDSTASTKEIEDLEEAASKYTPPGLLQYDCVASTCVLSQLLFHVHNTIGDEHPRFIELLRILRHRHIEIMVNALLAGGRGLLVSDFVSSDSLPELFTTTDLKTTLQDAIKQKNYLHGLNPAMVSSVLQQETFKTRLKSMQITDPWRWALPERVYACFALSFLRL